MKVATPHWLPDGDKSSAGISVSAAAIKKACSVGVSVSSGSTSGGTLATFAALCAPAATGAAKDAATAVPAPNRKLRRRTGLPSSVMEPSPRAASARRNTPSAVRLIPNGARREELLRTRSAQFSTRPVGRLVNNLAADHGHQRADVGDADLFDGERIGAEHREVGELAGLQRAFLGLVEGQIGAVVGGAAQRVGARQRLLRRDTFLAVIGAAPERLPDRQE